MRYIWILTTTNLKRYSLAVAMSLFGAAVLCMALYFTGMMVADRAAARVSVGMLDYDNSSLSEDMKRYLTEKLDYQLVENNTYEELSMQLIDKKISIIIEVPEEFYTNTLAGNKPEIIVTSLDDYENVVFANAYMNSYLGSIRNLAAGAGGDSAVFDRMLQEYPQNDITITRSTAAGIDTTELRHKSGFIIAIGFFLMFVFIISYVIANLLDDDRISGVFRRIQLTPVKPAHYLVGSGIFGAVLCGLEIALFILYIQMNELKIGVSVWVVILLMSLFSVFTICLSMAVALATKSKEAILAAIIGFSTVGCILGGAYFPIDMAPKTLQNIARIMPQYWFMDALRRLQEDSHAVIYPNIIILCLFILLAFLTGAVAFAQDYKKS